MSSKSRKAKPFLDAGHCRASPQRQGLRSREGHRATNLRQKRYEEGEKRERHHGGTTHAAPILAGRDWEVAHQGDERRSFISTDAPVLLTIVAPRPERFWNYGRGFGNADALVFFPLTRSCVLLVCGDSGDLRHVPVSNDRVRGLNLALAEKCQRFVVARD